MYALLVILEEVKQFSIDCLISVPMKTLVFWTQPKTCRRSDVFFRNLEAREMGRERNKEGEEVRIKHLLANLPPNASVLAPFRAHPKFRDRTETLATYAGKKMGKCRRIKRPKNALSRR